jgi:8-oxo-dGTP pyrophosphatase MutT (NUDIX family)
MEMIDGKDASSVMEFAQKAVIFDVSGRVLLVARLASNGRFLKWELPGGRVKLHENLDEGFMREIWEEVGLGIVPGPPVHLWTDNGGQIIAAARIAYSKPGKVTAAHRVPGERLGEIQWFTMQQLDTIPMDDAYREAVSFAQTLQGKLSTGLS